MVEVVYQKSTYGLCTLYTRPEGVGA